MAYKAAIFDIDGTLLDSLWVWEYIDRQFQKEMRITVSEDYYKTIVHMTTTESAEYTIKEYNLDVSVDELEKIWSDMALKIYTNEIELKTGAKELLEDLKLKEIKISLATSCFPELCESALTNLSVIDKFDTMQYTSKIGKNKSNPDIYLACANELGVEPQECVVFEDIITPLEPVKNLGMGFIGVHDDLNKQMHEELQNKADYYIENYYTFMKSNFYKHAF